MNEEQKQLIREKFKNEMCWQDTDGKWFLEGDTDTVPDLIDFWLNEISLAIKQTEERIVEKNKKVVVYVSQENEHNELSHEDRLKLNASEVRLYLADSADGVWGDDWNDAPDDCNSGTPYEDTMKNPEEIIIKLGQPITLIRNK